MAPSALEGKPSGAETVTHLGKALQTELNKGLLMTEQGRKCSQVPLKGTHIIGEVIRGKAYLCL